MLVRRHERNGVHENTEPPGAQGKRVQVQPTDRGIGTEEMMAAKRTSGDHQGIAGDHEAGVRHASMQSTNRATIRGNDFNALRRLERRIPPYTTADANLGRSFGVGRLDHRFIDG
jgi:hypothetical protein